MITVNQKISWEVMREFKELASLMHRDDISMLIKYLQSELLHRNFGLAKEDINAEYIYDDRPANSTGDL